MVKVYIIDIKKQQQPFYYGQTYSFLSEKYNDNYRIVVCRVFRHRYIYHIYTFQVSLKVSLLLKLILRSTGGLIIIEYIRLV